MAGKKAPETAEAAPETITETITVQLANAQRTSAGDATPGQPVTLPADEARLLLRDGLAVRA
jgi:hypothetical protein